MSSPEDQNTYVPRVCCVVITFNRDDFVSECIASLLREDGTDVAIEITVINNAATDTTAEVLSKVDDPRVSIRTNDENMPLTLVWNDALRIGHASGADYFLLLNDDIEMKPGAIAELVGVCQAEPTAIVTPLQINYRQPDELDGPMRSLLQATPKLIDDMLLRGAPQRYYRQRTLIGAALLGRLETFRAVGDFDPIFSFYGLDDDYANRARDMGIPRLVATQAHMLHLHGKTTDTRQASKKAWQARWSTQYQARAVFRIKDPEGALRTNFIKVITRVAWDVPRFLFKRFPGGSLCAVRTFVFLAGRYGQMSDRRDYEEAQRAAYKTSRP